MANNSTSFHNVPQETKIYVDGFRIDTIQTPKLGDDITEVALTAKVRALLKEEGVKVSAISAVPKTNPRVILIVTEM